MENQSVKCYCCESCNFETKILTHYNHHLQTKKHARNGMPKNNKCDLCEYKGLNHWNLRAHALSVHSTKEQRQESKYYCELCDMVFFCSAYKTRHINGVKHQNKEKNQEPNIK